MSRRTTIVLIVLIVLVIGGIYWLTSRKDKTVPAPVLSVSAQNQTMNVPATEKAAHPQDVIVFTLTAENQEDEVIPGYIVEANISEISDKASLVDASGAAYNAGTNSLVWTPIDIPANDSVTKQFTVRVNPGTAKSVMKIKFNNELAITIADPVVSGANNTAPNPPYQAPTSGPSQWVPVLLAMLLTVGFIVQRKYRLAKA